MKTDVCEDKFDESRERGSGEPAPSESGKSGQTNSDGSQTDLGGNLGPEVLSEVADHSHNVESSESVATTFDTNSTQVETVSSTGHQPVSVTKVTDPGQQEMPTPITTPLPKAPANPSQAQSPPHPLTVSPTPLTSHHQVHPYRVSSKIYGLGDEVGKLF